MSGYQHHLVQPQPWVVEQERVRHDEAMYIHGEYALVILLWDLKDHQKGYVQRCPECYSSYGKIADAYGQSATSQCASCFGTTWEGGWKAKILRPTLWDFTDEDQTEDRRGETTRQTGSIQFPWDFDSELRAYVVRGDGSRWKIVDQPQGTYLRSGFGTPTMSLANVALSSARVAREENFSVIYSIPPDDATLLPILQDATRRYPITSSDVEEIRAPIL